MKTIMEWYDELPDGIREKAKEYCFDNNKDAEAKSLAHALIGGFGWVDTPEGYEFWRTVHDQILEEEEPNKPLPRGNRGPGGIVTVEEIIIERGANYGHPYDHFQSIANLFAEWSKRRASGKTCGTNLDKCLSHIVYMIFDKLTRAAENPMHMDNFDDIQGYASLWAKCIEKNKEAE